jgi:hypothetical protein
MKQIKIYLDHKDYIQITRGLLGDKNCKEDVDSYKTLLNFVENDKVIIYFSWVHFCEALRYKGQQADVLNTYCEVVDSLTKGNCIIFPYELQKRELELYLSKEFNFETEIPTKEYPYGKYMEALTIEPFEPISILQIIKDDITKSVTDRKDKKYLLKRLNNPKTRKRIFKKVPLDCFQELKEAFPSLYTKEKILQLIDNPDIFAKAFKDSFSFKNMIMRYNNQFPQLRQMAYFFEEHEKLLVQLIRDTQQLHVFLGKSPIDENKIVDGHIRKSVNSIKEQIKALSEKYQFIEANAKEKLISSKLEGIPSMYAIAIAFAEYLRRNRWNFDHGRSPNESDLRDLHHIINLPYVDFYVTDRFFVSIAKKYADSFNTTVVRNVEQLKDRVQALCL